VWDEPEGGLLCGAAQNHRQAHGSQAEMVNGAVGPGSAFWSGSLSKFLTPVLNILILMCASTLNIQGRNRVR
jgi:hypothetical protein